MSFINLHVHSSLGSLLDSMLTVDDIVKYAKENNQNSIALTDHGFMHGNIDHIVACQKAGIKPIMGNEVYECDNPILKNDTKEHKQPRYHLILLCVNTEGKNNLYRIVTDACTNGFYIKPRTSVQWIKDNGLGKGIICLTACQAGRLSKYLVDGKEEEAKTFYDLLENTFDYVCCELQSHPTEDQYRANAAILGFAQKYNKPYCITSDAHMKSADDIEAHSIFVAIGDGREVGETYQGCHLQNEEDIYNYLGKWFEESVIKKGINETQHIADMVDGNIDYELAKGTVMPQAHIPEGYTLEEYFRYLVYKNFDNKFGYMSEEEQKIRRERIESEIPVLKELDFLNYLLVIREFCVECRNRGIPLGYSRGSAANSLCVFMLDITQIDSVRWGLDFTRFANLGRKGTAADIDTDLSKRRRQDGIQVLRDIFGADHVCSVATFNTLSTKVAIRDIGKVLNEKENSPYFNQIPYTLRDEVTKLIPTVKTLNDLGEEEDKETLLKDIVGKNPKLDEVYKKFPDWFKYVMKLEGLPKSRGKHASAILVTPKPILYYMPMCLDTDKNVMSMFEMHACQDPDKLGTTKVDALGLDSLDVIDDTLKFANLTWKDVDINHLDLEDKSVYDEVYSKGNTVGVFQFESYECRKMCLEVHADQIENIIAINALNRPGTKDSFPEYCHNKLYPDDVHPIHKDLKELFKNTNAVLLYQEDALHLLGYAGFNEIEQETGRRAIGKKKIDVMRELKNKFIDGLLEKGWTNKQTEDMWKLVLKQTSYSFNRGHAVAYSLLSYLMAYLKVHYPTEFMTALLTAKSDNTAKLSTIIAECNRIGIQVLPPKINKSSFGFVPAPSKKEILFGFNAVKGIGESSIANIIANRPYKNFVDYLDKIQDKTTTIALIKAGAFPVKSKYKLMCQYANSLFEKKEYKPVVSYGTKAKLLLDWDINVDDYTINNKIDKETVLKVYNEKRKKRFEQEQTDKIEIAIADFLNKYAQDEYLWEYESLSMFLTNNPMQDGDEILKKKWCDIDDGSKAVVIGIISDVKRKKDKHNNQFAYIDIITSCGIIEATIWSRQFKEFSNLINKGNCVAILGRKEDDHMFIERIKPYKQWLSDVTHKKPRVV